MSELDLDLARRTLDAQPFSRLLGARVTRFGGGSAVLEVDVRDELLQQNGFLHGECWRTRPTTRSPSRPGRRWGPPC